MKKSINTFLKHPTKDNTNRSANPPVARASTILFDTMQELYRHELKIKKHKKVTHYSYGRYGSTTTIELENIIKELLEHNVQVDSVAGSGKTTCSLYIAIHFHNCNILLLTSVVTKISFSLTFFIFNLFYDQRNYSVIFKLTTLEYSL